MPIYCGLSYNLFSISASSTIWSEVSLVRWWHQALFLSFIKFIWCGRNAKLGFRLNNGWMKLPPDQMEILLAVAHLIWERVLNLFWMGLYSLWNIQVSSLEGAIFWGPVFGDPNAEHKMPFSSSLLDRNRLASYLCSDNSPFRLL